MNNVGRLRLAPLTLYTGAVTAPLRVSSVVFFSEFRNPKSEFAFRKAERIILSM